MFVIADAVLPNVGVSPEAIVDAFVAQVSTWLWRLVLGYAASVYILKTMGWMKYLDGSWERERKRIERDGWYWSRRINDARSQGHRRAWNRGESRRRAREAWDYYDANRRARESLDFS